MPVSQAAYDLMKKKLKDLSQPKESEFSLKDQSEYTTERSYGNYSDCFSDGQSAADATTALSVRKVLTEVLELEKKDVIKKEL